jgi:hypothetical protein
VKTQHFVDLLQREPVEAYDLGLGSVNGRQYAARLLLAFYIDYYPRFMISVIAAEFRIREVMRPRLEKDLNGMKAGLFFRFMRDFNQEFRHLDEISLLFNVIWFSDQLF